MNLQVDYREEQNRVRRELYGNEKMYFLHENGTTVFDLKFLLESNFMIDFNSKSDAIIEISTDQYDDKMVLVTHVAFKGKIYDITDPVKDSMGTFPLWKMTGNPTQAKYVPAP